MAKNSFSKFTVASGQELIISDERKGYDHHSNFVHLEYIGFNAKNKSQASDKFWQGWTEGSTFVFRFGARGTKPAPKSKPCDSSYTAKRMLDEKVREKIKSGYERVKG